MNEAELYKNNNALQKKGTVEILKEYSLKMKWRNKDANVIDIGCGDGSVTAELLKNYMPNNIKKITGCDLSKTMVNYANNRYKDENIAFVVQDIEGTLPEELVGKFDYAFSFYTLHWIMQQEKAFTNIYDLLNNGGDCLLVFLGHMPIFDVYRTMAESHKWSRLMRNVDRFVSPYHDSQEPEKEVKRMMEEIGFTNVDVKMKEMLFVFDDVENLKKAVLAVNPFNIPKDLHEEFLEDYLNIVNDMRLMDEANNNISKEVRFRANYKLIIAYASK